MKVILEDLTPSPVAFADLYEKGDYWIKIKGCEDCSLDRRKRCCGNCPMLSDDGYCVWQKGGGVSKKPFHCVVLPTPDKCQPGCALEYQCVKGSNAGRIRRVTDRGGVFR